MPSSRTRRFSLAVMGYALLCVLATIAIVLRGDGPHPRMVSVYPPNGDAYFPGGTVQIAFSQPMNEPSVERALQVVPGGQGQGQWFGNILNLQAMPDWKPGVTYHVSLTGTVQDDQGRSLHTPIHFWFRVHHVGRLALCSVASVQTVCEHTAHGMRQLFKPRSAVTSFALSSDGSQIAYIRRDRSGLPHLFLINVDGTYNARLTGGTRYADSNPSWPPTNAGGIDYTRRDTRTGRTSTWEIGADGSDNGPL